MVLNFDRNFIDEERNISTQSEGWKVNDLGLKILIFTHSVLYECPVVM